MVSRQINRTQPTRITRSFTVTADLVCKLTFNFMPSVRNKVCLLFNSYGHGACFLPWLPPPAPRCVCEVCVCSVLHLWLPFSIWVYSSVWICCTLFINCPFKGFWYHSQFLSMTQSGYVHFCISLLWWIYVFVWSEKYTSILRIQETINVGIIT
jgi:hypothetical protein